MEKKKIAFALSTMALMMALCGCASTSGVSNSGSYSDTPWQGGGDDTSSSSSSSAATSSDKTLTGIEIASQPTETTYVEGERFAPDGMLIQADYDDGTNEDVFDYTYDLVEALKVTDTQVVVSYHSFTVNIPITVQALQKFEAENYSSQCGALAARAEDAAAGTYSGTGYLGSWDLIAGRWVEFDIDSTEAATAEFYCCLDCPESSAKDWNSRFTVEINGQSWEASDDAVYAVDNPAWFQWLDVDLGSINFVAGTNTIKITEISAMTNMDYIGFISEATLSLHQ